MIRNAIKLEGKSELSLKSGDDFYVNILERYYHIIKVYRGNMKELIFCRKLSLGFYDWITFPNMIDF